MLPTCALGALERWPHRFLAEPNPIGQQLGKPFDRLRVLQLLIKQSFRVVERLANGRLCDAFPFGECDSAFAEF